MRAIWTGIVMGSRKPDARATRIVDVARVSGVSPQTVSNVVNGRGGYTEETRLRVLEAIEQTGYRPNRAARQLRTRQAKQIAFCLEGGNLESQNPFTISLLRAVVETARPSGHRVVVFTWDPDDPDEFESWVRAGDADGYLYANATPGDPRAARLASSDLPFVAMGRTLRNEPQSWVDIDNRKSMASVVDYLVAKGHRRFGFVGEDGTKHWSVERREGARDRLADHGFALPDEHILIGDFDAISARLDEVLPSPRRPSALMTSSDTLAALVGIRARVHGLAIGRDLAVSGFDGGLLDWVLDPPLTTVRIPIERVAQTMVSRLLREIDSGPTADPGEFLDTELVVGGSA